MVLLFIPIETLFQNDASSQTFENLDAFLQCFEVLKTFSQSVSRSWIITPWSLHLRIRFLRLHILQSLLVSFCHEPLRSGLFLIRRLTELFNQLETAP